jgi:hypothetical protein
MFKHTLSDVKITVNQYQACISENEVCVKYY